MHPLAVIFLVIGTVVTVGSILIATHIHLQHQRVYFPLKLLQKACDQPQAPTQLSLYRPLTDPYTIFVAWYQSIVNAERDVWFSTYVWHVHEVPEWNLTTPHIQLLGRALIALDARLDHLIPVRFIINQSSWMMNDTYVKECWEKTWALWHTMGFRAQHVDVQFRVWKHHSLNNIHGKLCLVDDKEAVMTSINIERESYGGPNSWYESGAWVSNETITKKLRQFLQKYWDASRLLQPPEQFLPVPEEQLGLVDSMGNGIDQKDLEWDLPVYAEVPVQVYMDHAVSSLYHKNYLDSTISVRLIQMIMEAEETIDLMTPTFNHPALWTALVAACQNRPHLRIRIIMGWQFNVTNPFSQKHFLGYPLNADFVSDKLNYPQISWKWYAHQGRLASRNSGSMCHGKIAIIDSKRGKSSSFNMDVWSALNSMETAFFYESEAVAHQYLEDLFEPRWKQGIPINNANLHTKVVEPVAALIPWRNRNDQSL